MIPDITEHSQERQEEFYTLEEAAKILKISKSTMRRYLLDGKVYGINMGKLWRVPRDSIERIKSKGDETGASGS